MAQFFKPGENCCGVARASQASIIIDAADYFEAVRAAMSKAKQRIMLVGWDFDTRIKLDGAGQNRDTQTVGDFIYALVKANPALQVQILRWDMGTLKILGRGSMVLTMAKWLLHDRIHTKLDGTHPTGACHHQKIVVIDDCMAFCGGIDITSGRWDTRAHRDDDPRRLSPDDSPHPPWHDSTCAVSGEAAAMLGTVCRERWARAGGGHLEPIDNVHDCWPAMLPVDFTDVDIAVSRSEPAMEDRTAVLEIEHICIDMIERAERFIYVESQYFASRRIAKAIADRLDREDCPEIIVINPVEAEGWLEQVAMDTARARFVEALRRRDTRGRFRVYIPHTSGGEPIYVHAKIMIIDEAILKIGSSNFNNRSMRLDTECDLAIDAGHRTAGIHSETIRDIRNGLIAEHLGVAADEVTAAIAFNNSLIETIEALRPQHDQLRPYEMPDPDAVSEWVAENEIFDPEQPDEMFEPIAKPGIIHGIL